MSKNHYSPWIKLLLDLIIFVAFLNYIWPEASLLWSEFFSSKVIIPRCNDYGKYLTEAVKYFQSSSGSFFLHVDPAWEPGFFLLNTAIGKLLWFSERQSLYLLSLFVSSLQALLVYLTLKELLATTENKKRFSYIPKIGLLLFIVSATQINGLSLGFVYKQAFSQLLLMTLVFFSLKALVRRRVVLVILSGVVGGMILLTHRGTGTLFVMMYFLLFVVNFLVFRHKKNYGEVYTFLIALTISLPYIFVYAPHILGAVKYFYAEMVEKYLSSGLGYQNSLVSGGADHTKISAKGVNNFIKYFLVNPIVALFGFLGFCALFRFKELVYKNRFLVVLIIVHLAFFLLHLPYENRLFLSWDFLMITIFVYSFRQILFRTVIGDKLKLLLCVFIIIFSGFSFFDSYKKVKVYNASDMTFGWNDVINKEDTIIGSYCTSIFLSQFGYLNTTINSITTSIITPVDEKFWTNDLLTAYFKKFYIPNLATHWTYIPKPFEKNHDVYLIDSNWWKWEENEDIPMAERLQGTEYELVYEGGEGDPITAIYKLRVSPNFSFIQVGADFMDSNRNLLDI